MGKNVVRQLTLSGIKVPEVDWEPKESADRERTKRQKEMIALGVHPATKRRIQVDSVATCRDCVHCIHTHGGARNYWKCEKAGVSHSAASDIRLWWPSCALFESAAVSGD